jgi:hypothetical protein
MPKRFLSSLLLAAIVSGLVPFAPAVAATPSSGKLLLATANGFATAPADGSAADGSHATVLGLQGGQPTWSPDGARFAYKGEDGIYVAGADGKGAKKVSTGGGADRNPAWSPDGKTIAFGRSMEVWRVNPDGTGEARVTTKPTAGCDFGSESKDLREAYDPALSPDGTKFVVLGTSCYKTSLFVVGADGGGARFLDLPQVAFGGYEPDPEWSPDGKTIAFYGRGYQDPQGFAGVWLVAADGGSAPRKLIANLSRLAWSPDGTEVAATSADEVVAYKTDGTGAKRTLARGATDVDWVGAAAPPPTNNGRARFVATSLNYADRLEKLKAKVRPLNDKLESDKKADQVVLDGAKKELDAAATKQEALRKEMDDLRYRIDQYFVAHPELADQKDAPLPYQDQLKAVNDDWKAEALKISVASKTFTEYELKIRDIERQQLTLSEPLNTMDFDLDGITIRAEGRPSPVYDWRYADQWAAIDKLDLQITFMAAHVAELKGFRDAAFDDFVRMTREATDKQISIVSILHQHMAGKFATTTVKLVWDMYKASAEGGPPAVVAEMAKKLIESYLAYDSNYVGSANPDAAKVEAWYKKSVRDTLKQDAKDLAAEKTKWDLPVDTALEEATLCRPLLQKLSQSCDAATAKAAVASHVVERAKAARKALEHLKLRILALGDMAQKKSFLEFARRSLKLSVKKVFAKLQDLGPDLQEVVLNRIMDEREMNAWFEFNHLDLMARNQRGLYDAADQQYETEKEQLDALEAAKSQALAEWDKTAKRRVTAKARFKVPEQVIVEVHYSQLSGDLGAPLPIEVWVSGIQAEPGPTTQWGRKYYLTKTQLLSLTDEQRDALTVELR